MKAKSVTFSWVAFNGDLSGPNMTFGRLTLNDTLLMSLYITNAYCFYVADEHFYDFLATKKNICFVSYQQAVFDTD